jgi:hypothetical protein
MKKLLFTAIFSATALLNAQDKIIVEYRQVNEYDEEKQKQFNAELAQKGINIGSMEMHLILIMTNRVRTSLRNVSNKS